MISPEEYTPVRSPVSELLSPHFIIIGGGISGLSAAWEIVQRAPQARVTLLEREGRWGGKIVTDVVTLPGEDGEPLRFVIDGGPESFITRKPAGWELAGELGLREHVAATQSETSNIYVLDGGRPELIPMSPAAFVNSSLLSWRGKLRLMAEPLAPARRDDGDESLADFAARRLGREALEKFLGPVLGGIYNSDPERQSIMTTSPVMREMERENGSLFVATVARARTKAQRRKELAARGEAVPPAFMAFADGSQILVDKLVARLQATGRVEMRLNASVLSIAQEGAGWSVTPADGETIRGESVIVTTPANAAARMVAQAAPQSASLLSEIQHAGIGTISLIYRERDLSLGFPISGLMIPRRERRAIDAMTFTSVRFRERVPQGYAMLRVFFGGGAPHIMLLDEEQLPAAVRGELRALLGITAEPLASVAHRWPQSYPQAAVGHLDLVAAIEHSLPPGLYVTGSPYRGLGVPDCIGQARTTARQAVEALRIGTHQSYDL